MAENKTEQVVTVNCFDKLFGKNGKLVEERKKQVLAGALEIVQRYCEETPNKMEIVAKLFGKKLGEEFVVKVPWRDEYGNIKRYVEVKGGFGSRGFESDQITFADAFIFAELLEGGAVIVDE